MKRFITITLSAALMAAGCNPLDTMIDSYTTQETLDTQYSSVIRVAYAQYGYLVDGLAELDGNIAAPKSDEAVATSTSASSRKSFASRSFFSSLTFNIGLALPYSSAYQVKNARKFRM